MDNIGCAQERSLIPRAKKKKKAKNELDPLKQAERKRRRLEKALATSAAIRSELEEKKRRKKEQEQLDEEGAAIAEAVALHVLCEDSDDSHQIVLKNHSMDLDSLQEQDSNIGLFIGGWKASMPRSGVGKYSIKGRGWVSDAYGSGCNCNDRGIRWSFAPKIVDQGLPALCVKGKGEAAEISPGLIAAQAVSSLQIREDHIVVLSLVKRPQPKSLVAAWVGMPISMRFDHTSYRCIYLYDIYHHTYVFSFSLLMIKSSFSNMCLHISFIIIFFNNSLPSFYGSIPIILWVE